MLRASDDEAAVSKNRWGQDSLSIHSTPYVDERPYLRHCGEVPDIDVVKGSQRQDSINMTAKPIGSVSARIRVSIRLSVRASCQC